MPHKIEEKGFAHLIECIQKLGQSVSRQNGTFDLTVDGNNAELKAKGKPFGNIDFITFTENQYEAIMNGPVFDIYIVCGVNAQSPEVYSLPSDKLRSVQPNKIASYEYSRSRISRLVAKIP